MRIAGFVSLLLVAGLGMSCDSGRPVILPQPHLASAVMEPLSGAIFTTTPDGTIVNENVHYASKLEVYLDGGPGPNAPKNAAALPTGNYYFQVTDPSGKVLLSEDPAKCRKIRIEEGLMVGLLNAGATYPGGKKGAEIPCHVQYGVDGQAGPAGHHDLNTDADYGSEGARVVQLMPFLDTPNNGGVYKAWIVPEVIYDLTGDAEAMPVSLPPGKVKGFEPDPGFADHKYTKTDNFKAKGKPNCPYPPTLVVRKFHDANLNGVWDEGEEEVTGWQIDLTDPLGSENTRYTKVEEVALPVGLWTVAEALPQNVYQTAAILDGAPVALSPTVSVTFTDECNGETHTVDFGNHGVGDVTACKSYDRNGNGVDDPGELPVAGWKMRLEGGNLTAAVEQVTGADGCTTFEDLMPGTYTVTELMPTSAGWAATGDTVETVIVESKLVGGTITGTATPPVVTFTNVCTGTADFGTKGYWHNKNGLQEILDAAITYVNTQLPPYMGASSYFDAGDEPFDGYFSDGVTKVAAAYSDEDLALIAGEGTPRAEISHFLVDTNATGDPREQLAQQLLAFVFNAIYRLGGVDGAFLLDGTYVVASDLIDQAVAAWSSGDDIKQVEIKDILDTLNNSDAVPFIHATPCAIAY